MVRVHRRNNHSLQTFARNNFYQNIYTQRTNLYFFRLPVNIIYKLIQEQYAVFIETEVVQELLD